MAAHLVSSRLGRDSASPSEALDAATGEEADFARLSAPLSGSRASVLSSGTSTSGARGSSTHVAGHARVDGVSGAAARLLGIRLGDGSPATPNAPWGEEGEGLSRRLRAALCLPHVICRGAFVPPYVPHT